MNKNVVLFISLLLDLLGFTIILPLIPSILDYYAANDDVSCVAQIETVTDLRYIYL